MQAGLLLLPFSIAVIAGATIAAPAITRWTPTRAIAVGLSAIAIFDAGLTFSVDSAWTLVATVVIGGAGIGLSSVAATGLATSVPKAMRGAASGVVNTAAQIGTAVGVAVLLLVAGLSHQFPAPGVTPPVVAWTVAAAASACGAIVYAVSPRHAAGTDISSTD